MFLSSHRRKRTAKGFNGTLKAYKQQPQRFVTLNEMVGRVNVDIVLLQAEKSERD